MASSLDRDVFVALAVQPVHALGQAALWSTVDGRVGLALAIAAFVAAVGALLYAIRRLATESVPDGRVDDADQTVDPITRSSIATLRESTHATTLPGHGRATVTDGGVDAAAIHETAQAYAQGVTTVGDGDLTARLDESVEDPEMATLAREFNAAVTQFQQTITTAAEFSDDLVGNSEQVAAATDAVREASENVSASVQEIGDVFLDQHHQISEISEEMSDMSATIEEIAASSDQVSQRADQTEERTVEGIESAREARDAMVEADDQTDQVVEAVENLDDQMREIGSIVDMIDDIAEQTNILALNASIEAAHASSGEQTGFGVVADEVKQLAEKTKSATGQIEDLIEDAQEQTDDTVDEIHTMSESVERSRGTIEESLDALESILDHVQNTTSGIKEISSATDDQASTTEEVASTADELAEVSRQNVDEAEHIAAIAEEQTLALGEMSVNAKMLTMRATQLATLFDRYETED
ncbi:MAG: methyl-accepting chemotaxis protein [Halococcoides sp.]